METEIRNILLVEDNIGDARFLYELLKDNWKHAFSFTHVDRIQKALQSISESPYDLLLLDLTLPDSSGIETVQRICHAAPHIPIIVLTGLEDDSIAIESVQIGAQDYLVKGQVTGPFLIRAINHAIERKKMAERLQYLATDDLLTDLPNRGLLQDRLTHAIDKSIRNRNGSSDKWEIAVMLLDLDNFKLVNDTFGHPQGDKLLIAIADRLRNAIRKSDTVARMGGDEFMILFEDIGEREDVEGLGQKILDLFSEPFQISGHNLQITASVGISIYPFDGEDFQTLMKAADIAMYHAKRERNQFSLYNKAMKIL
jgi:diguanylate cyclase (GGDEF)-like protein